jgi:uncharacterized membrane protein
MSWVIIALIAYIFIGTQTLLDKFLISSERIAHPAIYTFYSGILSLPILLLAPLGFHRIGGTEFFWNIFSGALFVYGILFLFFALRKNEASRVVPIVGAVVPVVTFILSFFVLGSVLKSQQIIGVILLILGGFLISFETENGNKKTKKLFSGFYLSIISGIFFGIAFVIFKKLYLTDNFFNVFLWTRIGLFAGAMTLFLIPNWRKIIINSFLSAKKAPKKDYQTGFLFVGNKILGGVGSILLQRAVSIGEVTIVNALVSIQYAFIFVVGIFLSLHWPEIFHEKRNKKEIWQKIFAIAIITVGIFYI